MRIDELQWYHGANIEKKHLSIGRGGEDQYGRGIYLTSNPKRAKTYFSRGKGGSGYLHSVSATTGNEYNFADQFTKEDAEQFAALVPKVVKFKNNSIIVGGKEIPINSEKAYAFAVIRKLFGGSQISEILKALGYDSVISPDPTGGKQAVIFDPNNTKVTDVRLVESTLVEGISSVVYHATSFPGAFKILKTGKMRGPEISFTRSLTGSYHRSNRLIGVIFQFDGDKINQRYKGGPVGTEHEDWDTGEIEYTGKANKQYEDRVYAKDGISNSIKYMTAAILYAPREYLEKSHTDRFDSVYKDQIKYVDEVVALLDHHSIPYRYVATESGLSKKTSNKVGFDDVVYDKWEVVYYDYTGSDPDDFDYMPEPIKQTILAKDLNTALMKAKKHVTSDFMLGSLTNTVTGDTWDE